MSLSLSEEEQLSVAIARSLADQSLPDSEWITVSESAHEPVGQFVEVALAPSQEDCPEKKTAQPSQEDCPEEKTSQPSHAAGSGLAPAGSGPYAIPEEVRAYGNRLGDLQGSYRGPGVVSTLGRAERITWAYIGGQNDSEVSAVYRSFAPGSEPLVPPCVQKVKLKPKHGYKVFCVLLKARRIAEPQRSTANFTCEVKDFRKIVGFSSE